MEDKRKIKDLQQRIAAPKPEYFTNRRALALLTSLAHDMKSLDRQWNTLKESFTEDQEKMVEIKNLIEKMSIVAAGFNNDYLKVRENEHFFSIYKSRRFSDDIYGLREQCFHIAIGAQNLQELMNSSTDVHNKPYPKGDHYERVVQLYNENKERLEIMAGGPYSMEDLNYMAREGTILPFIEVYYPSIAKSFKKMEPAEVKKIEEIIIRIIEHDTNLFSYTLSRDYLDSVMYTALMYSFDNPEDS